MPQFLSGYSETWADVKTPGDGRTYAVGTTWVTHTLTGHAQSVFSTNRDATGAAIPAPVAGPPGMLDAISATGPSRPVHVAILQITDSATGAILHQAFFHGDRSSQGIVIPQVQQTFARGISVFPAPLPPVDPNYEVETRIVICGETNDVRIPFGQGETITHSFTTNLVEASGFIAVYRGDGLLLWTYHFHGRDPFAATVITDVCIHRDDRFEPPRDVVTYCGLSQNGAYTVPPQLSTIDPLLWFVAPPSSSCGDVYNGGNTHNAFSTASSTAEWDGLVGRVWAEHSVPTPPATVTPVFHSIVGGWARDGFFGISEKNHDEFAVVGVTMRPAQIPALAHVVFPLTKSQWNASPICLLTEGLAYQYMHGVIVEFDASQTMPLPSTPPTQPGALLLVDSQLIGGASDAFAQRRTAARDVLWHGGRYYVVGSTTDPTFATFGSPCPLSNGFIAMKQPHGDFEFASYCPEKTSALSAASGAVGVAAWNEHADHVAVAGWTQPVQDGPRDLVVTSLFRDTTDPGASPHMEFVRQHVVPSANDESPSAPDIHPAFIGVQYFTTGLNWPQQVRFVDDYTAVTGFGNPAGGGVAVDPRGSITVVGNTLIKNVSPLLSPSYPVAPYPPTPESRDMQVLWGPTLDHFDAIRSVVDMLPAGVCRSDGTGLCPPPGWSPNGNGGTTPACALSHFGNILGTTPILNRMLVDYEGVPGPGQPVSLIVDRPPPSSWVVLSAWRLSFPSTTPDPIYLGQFGIEVWVDPLVEATFAHVPTGGSIRQSWGVPPPPWGVIFAAQYFCFLAQPLAGTPCTAPNLSYAATPAMIFSY